MNKQYEYEVWIKENVEGDGYGKCAEITEAMAKAFPELTRVRGHYYCPSWGERTHWWLTTPDGKIVDPTKDQHPSHGLGRYEPWVEGSPEPTGKCPNCGGYCYNGESTCSKKCYEEYRAYLMDLI